ncbi:MAG: DNA translocase FtsK, partial [Eubacteriales bacterium]|nr:DNA translocase FtsK [Eubacteriales bacterium]
MAYKKSTKKRTPAKKTGSSKSQSQKNIKERESEGKWFTPQVKAILLLVCAILLLALAVFPGQSAWAGLRGVFYGVFGFGFILIPLLLGYLSIMTAKEKQISRVWVKVILGSLIILLFTSLFFIFPSEKYENLGFFSAVGEMYRFSADPINIPIGGGVLSCILGYPLVKLCGGVFLPAFVVIVLLLASVMLLTGISLMDVANVAKRQMTALRKRRPRNTEDDEQYPANEQEQEQKKQSKTRIDIPIGEGKKHKKHQKPDDVLMDEDATAANEDAADKLINSILIANEGYTPEDENTASIIARDISRSKGKEHMTEGAKQPDPETVTVDPNEIPVDLDKETAAVESEIKNSDRQRTASRYTFPSVRLLRNSFDNNDEDAMREFQGNAKKLIETLKSFGVDVSISNICRGPSVTRYELKPAPGVKINKITNLADDIALALAAEGVRIEAPIPGKAAVGIEVPNKYVSTVTMRELIDSAEFRNNKSKLACVLGKDISGEIVTCDLAKMPHLLIAGTTGSGKSVCVNSLLMSILFKATPDEVKLLLVDPKMVEFSKYKGLPHLLIPVVSDAKKAAGALNWAVTEMMQRYKMFSEYDCKDITSFNSLVESNIKYIEENEGSDEEVCMEINGLPVPTEKMPRIVIAIDELADLMMVAAKEVEDAICRLAQMARAAGMHLVLATQRPTVNVITGLIKANIPSRIALKVSSSIDSRTILDFGGAENLIGRGDMLYSPTGASKPMRVQGCFATDEEIEGVTGYIKKQHRAQYNEEIEERIRQIAS